MVHEKGGFVLSLLDFENVKNCGSKFGTSFRHLKHFVF
jgi:hypothetical protein